MWSYNVTNILRYHRTRNVPGYTLSHKLDRRESQPRATTREVVYADARHRWCTETRRQSLGGTRREPGKRPGAGKPSRSRVTAGALPVNGKRPRGIDGARELKQSSGAGPPAPGTFPAPGRMAGRWGPVSARSHSCVRRAGGRRVYSFPRDPGRSPLHPAFSRDFRLFVLELEDCRRPIRACDTRDYVHARENWARWGVGRWGVGGRA